MSKHPEYQGHFECEVVKFRGTEYASNFRFKSQFDEADEIAIGTIVGIALAYLPNDNNQVLVWLGEITQVQAMSRKNYERHRNNGGFFGGKNEQ